MTTGALLIHGGATTARHWDLVLELLGTPAVAVDLPGRGARPADLASLTLDAACDSVAADAVTLRADRLVVVAHSSGGLLVPGLVARLPVAHVVLIAASVTADGGTGMDAMKPQHAAGLRQLRAACAAAGTPALTPAAAPSIDRMRGSWGGDMSDEQLTWLADPSRWVQDTTNFYDAVLDWRAVRALPSTYLLTLRDRAVPLAMQQRMAALLPAASCVPLDTGHLPAVTLPAAVAAIIDGIVSLTDLLASSEKSENQSHQAGVSA